MARPRKWTAAGAVATAARAEQPGLVLTDYDWLLARGWAIVTCGGWADGRVTTTWGRQGQYVRADGLTVEEIDALVRREVERREAAG